MMTHVTCRLTAKNRDRLRNPTLGNRVRAAFTFLDVRAVYITQRLSDRYAACIVDRELDIAEVERRCEQYYVRWWLNVSSPPITPAHLGGTLAAAAVTVPWRVA